MGKHHAAILFLALVLFPALALAVARAQTPTPPPPASTPAPTLTPTPTVPEVAALCIGGLDKCISPAKDNYGWPFAIGLLALSGLGLIVAAFFSEKVKGGLESIWNWFASRLRFVGIDPDTGEIQAATLTENSVSDDAMVEVLLKQIEQPLDTFAADGAYDKRKVYDRLNAHSPEVIILVPPRANARIWQHGNTKAERLKRDENLRYIRKHSRTDWKKDSGYHVRSLAETTMFRLKTIFGNNLSTRQLQSQATQALIRCAALNKMTQLGMPQSYKVA